MEWGPRDSESGMMAGAAKGQGKTYVESICLLQLKGSLWGSIMEAMEIYITYIRILFPELLAI